MTSIDPRSDRDAAERFRHATAVLVQLGAGSLTERPWQAPGQPPSAIDSIRYAVWRATATGAGDTTVHDGDPTEASAEPPGVSADPAALRAALTLMEAARAEVEALETGLLFLARAQGLTWAQISHDLGLRSPQAAQQRLERLSDRAT